MPRRRSLTSLVLLCVACGVTLAGMALPAVAGLGLLTRSATDSFEDLPSALNAPPPPQRTRILAADGTPIASFFEQDRVVVPLTKMSPSIQRAIVAIEDSRFFEHGALDLKGTMRAAATDLGSGSAVQGGSTLTQQYVKNVLLYTAHDKAATTDTLRRKLQEARYAIGVEKKLTKNQILAGYLNLVFFGEGAYGVEAAAHRYFGESASQLTVPQAALLAGLVQAPEDYDPIMHPVEALARRNVVLNRMAQVGDLTPAEASAATATPLGLHPTLEPQGCDNSRAPFFCDYIRRELLMDPRLGSTFAARERALMNGGLTIRTTLDPKAQHAAQQAVDNVVPVSSRVAASVVSVQPNDGGVEAMAVDRPFGGGKGQTRVNLALGGSSGFQAGSTFKMFTLAAAIEHHVPLSQTYYAPPKINLTGFTGCNGSALGSWSPKNAEDGEGGTFGLVRATWESVNTYFAQLERQVGVCAPWRLATQMGISEISTGNAPAQVPAFTLGTDDTSPLQVAAAYATLAANGNFCAPYGIASITDARGHVLDHGGRQCHQVMSATTAQTVTSILRGVIDGPDPLRTGASASIGRPAAGKTGTTDSFAAAWFTGFTPQLATSVWVGDPRGGAAYPLVDVSVAGRYYSHVFGADLPASIWKATMLGALSGVPVQNFDGIAATTAVDRRYVPHHSAPKPAKHQANHNQPGLVPPGHKKPPPKPHQH